MKTKICKDCGAALSKDEIALTKKLIDAKTKEFFCLNCMSDMFDCTRDDLEIKIEEFKEQGCTLFV